MEFYSTQPGIFDCKGNQVFANSVWPPEGIWWDADLGREFIERVASGQLAPTVNKFSPSSGTSGRVLSLYHDNVHQAYGGRPAFWGDIFGDWREETVLVTNDYSALFVYVSTTPATNRLYTLTQNPQYRDQITVKGYVQASYVDYYLGWGMTPPQPPPQSMANLIWRGDGTNVWDSTATANWRTNWFWVNNANTNPAVCNPGDSVLFDLTGSNNTAIALSGTLMPGDVTVYSPKNYFFDGSAGSLGGAMKLTKQGAGTLTLTGNHNFTGKTVVWDGAVYVNGNLQSSPVTVWGGTWGGALAAGKTGGRIGGTGQFSQSVTVKYRGAVTPGAGMNNPGTITFAGGFALEDDSALALDLSDDPTGTAKTNDLIVITGNLTVTGTNHIVINRLNTNLPPGTIYPLINYSGAFVGGLSRFDVSGVTGIPVALDKSAGPDRARREKFPRTRNDFLDGRARRQRVGFIDDTKLAECRSERPVRAQRHRAFDDTGATNLTVNLSGDLNCASIIVDSTTNYTIGGGGAIIGAAGLTKTNSGTLTINAVNNTFTGKTIVSGGTLVVSQLGAIGFPSSLGNPPGGSTNLILSGNATLRVAGESYSDRGMTLNSGTNTLDIVNGSDQLTIAGVITGSGGLVKAGSGALALNVNSYTGPTTIKSGGVSLGGGTANQYGFGVGPGGNGNTTVTMEGGTLTMFSDTSSYDTCYWNVVIPTNSMATIYGDARCNLYGALTGGGVLNFNIYYTRCELDGNWSAFTGQINMGTDSGGGDFRIGNTFGYANASVNLADHIYAYHASGSAVSLGAVTGGALSVMSGTPWTVGAKNIDSTYAGSITGKFPHKGWHRNLDAHRHEHLHRRNDRERGHVARQQPEFFRHGFGRGDGRRRRDACGKWNHRRQHHRERKTFARQFHRHADLQQQSDVHRRRQRVHGDQQITEDERPRESDGDFDLRRHVDRHESCRHARSRRQLQNFPCDHLCRFVQRIQSSAAGGRAGLEHKRIEQQRNFERHCRQCQPAVRCVDESGCGCREFLANQFDVGRQLDQRNELPYRTLHEQC